MAGVVKWIIPKFWLLRFGFGLLFAPRRRRAPTVAVHIVAFSPISSDSRLFANIGKDEGTGASGYLLSERGPAEGCRCFVIYRPAIEWRGTPPKLRSPGGAPLLLIRIRQRRQARPPRSLYSESQVTLKLDPSEVSADGVASSAPLLLTMVISSTSLLPKSLIGPDVEVSVA
jgi:hypothetical protein